MKPRSQQHDEQVALPLLPILVVDAADEPHVGYHLTKRAIDLLVCVPAFIVTAPLLALLAAAILATSGRPAFIKQRRVGARGREFVSMKLRTTTEVTRNRASVLAPDVTDGPRLTEQSTLTLTRLGRVMRALGLDELPQLLSVIRGDTSLVGPHAMALAEARFTVEQSKRLAVKPGLISAWTLSGRGRTSFEDWMRLDLEYVERRSLRHDLALLLRAPLALVRRPHHGPDSQN